MGAIEGGAVEEGGGGGGGGGVVTVFSIAFVTLVYDPRQVRY